MATWHEITRDPEYQELSEQGKALVKQGFFEREISSDPEFKAFSPQTQKAVFDDFWQTPDDTGQGIVTSTLGSAIRGAGEIVPGTLQGVGALTGITPISDLGESARAGLEYVAPVNPIYEQGIPAKVANVAGNVASIIGTSGVGGLAGKVLGAERAAAAGSAAARQALTNQAIQAGAKSALYGTGFAQGAAAKAEENKRLGITGAEGYLNLLGGGVSELAPEMLPFGTALESAAARRLLGGVDDAAGRVIPGIRMSAAQEAAEGGSTQVLSNLSTQLTAPTGVEAPGLFEGAGEAALWEGVGGAMFGAINKLGRTPPENQTDEQRAYAAELGAVPVDSSPPITPEESLENFNQGGIPVVSPDGVVTTLPFNREDIRATDLPFNREDIRASELPFTREDISPTQLPFNREDIRSTELPFSRQNIRGLSQLGQPAISPGLTAAVNTADSIVTTAENTSSDVSQATTAARNIIQGVVDTPQPREAPTELPAVTPSPAMEQTENLSQTITDSNGEIAPEMSVLPPTVQAGAGVGEAIQPQPIETAPDAIQEQITDEGLLRQERPEMELQGLGEGNAQPQEVAAEGQIQEEVAPPITPQGTPTPATEGTVMPRGSAIERETDEQKFQRIKSVSPSQRTDEDIAFANAFSKRQKELKPQAGEATRKAFLANHTASIGGRLRKALDQTITFRGLKGTVGSWAETLYNEGWRMALDARGNRQFTNGTEALGSSGLGKVGMNYADFLSSQPQTTTVAAPTETAAPSAKEAAVASVVQQPVEGSIPTVEQESAITAIESTEKTDVAKEAMRFLEADLTDTQRAKWTPEMFAAAQAFFDSGGKDFDSLKKAIKFPRVVQQAYLKADKEAAAEQTRREAADAAMAREVEKATKEQAKLEADQKQREKLGLKTLNSLIEKTRTNVVQGTVKSSDANQAVAILNKSGAIPNVLFTWIGTSKDFLADPANRARYPETWMAVSNNNNAEGWSENGQPIVFTDNVGVSDLDRNLAKLQGTTPEIAAVRRVILHENIHKGMFFLILKDKMKLFQFLHRLYSPEELDQLAKSYDEYSDWRINQVSYFSIIEEAMTRDFDSMAEIPRDGIWAEFMQFLRDIWQKITGKTSEPTLKNYKDVFRLIRNSLKNSEAANADMLVNGGKTKYETYDTSIRPYASQGYGSQRMEGVSTGDNSPRAQAIRKAVSESNWNELSPTQRAKALEEFGIESIQSRYSFDATLLPVRVTNERTPKNRPASILSAGPSPAITIQFDTSGLADLLSGDAVTAFANIFDMAQEEVIHAAQHLNIYNRWKTSKSTDSVGLYELKHYTSMINEVAKIAGDELRNGNPAVANVFTNAWNLYNPNDQASDVNDAIGKIKSAPEAAAFAMELSRMMLQMQRQDFTTETGWMRFVEAMKAMLADITNALRTALAMAKNGQVGKRLQDEISEVNALINDLESASQPMASKVTYDSPNEAAFNSGAEVARNADYDERDKAVRSTIRAAYDLAPKPNGPSVPLDQLFDIAKQSMTDLTEGEFSQILQDLYEDSGALLMEGEVAEYSDPMDYEYMTAVEAGDMATAQRMVDESINDNLLKDYYHGGEAGGRGYIVQFVFGRPDESYWQGATKKRQLWRTKTTRQLTDEMIKFGAEYFTLDEEAAKDLMNPSDIIDSAGAWDDPQFVSEFWQRFENDLLKNGDAFEVGNGAIAFPGSESIERISDPVTYDEAGNVIPLSQRFNTDGNDIRGNIIVTTPDGQRAGSVIVMPPSGFQTRAMASIVDSPATNEFTQSVDGINNGTAKAAFSGRQFKDFKPIDRTVKSAEEYSDVAIKYVNNLEKEGVSLKDIANSVISPAFLESIGIEQDLMAQDALTIEVRQRVDDEARKEKSPGRRKQLSKLSERLSAFWQGVGSKKGQHLGQRRYLVNKARYSWMFIRELAEKAMKEARTNILISNFGSENATSFTQNSYENADMANQMAADENVNAAENDAEWSLIKEGVEILEGEAKSIWQRMAQLLRRFAFYARRKTMRAANAKASLTDSERNELNAILQMSDEEAAKAEAKDLAEFIALGKRFLGEESDANTQEKKTVRKKREKMVEVAKKRADKGQTIDPAETANDIAIRLLNEFENKLAKSAFFNSATKPDTIVKAFREQISDPMDRKAFKDRLMAMEVTSEMADKLFDKAARTKDNAQWKRAQDMLEGPNALRNIIREINRARPGDQAPLSKQIPWRELLSQKASTVEEYRQRIFDAISANEELKSATPDQKSRLADLFAEAWEANRTRILDGMLERMIRAEEAKKNLSKEGAKALQAQRMRIVEDINLGIFDNDELAKRMAEKFGVKSEFTEMEREKINSLIEVLQDEGLNAVKRQVAAYKLLEVLQGELKIPVAKMLADFWVSSVLSGPNTIVSIGLAVASGAFELSTALSRVFIAGFTNPKQLPSEIAGAYKTLARLLSAFGRQSNIAWQYLVTGDPAFLDPSMNDVTENMQWGNIGKSNKLAEQMAKSDKILVKSAGLFMRTVSRLLTALDVFNSGLTKEGSLSIVFRQIGLDPEKIAALEKKSDLKPYKDAIIRKDFGGTPPKSARDKAIVDSYALADMMAELDKLGNVSENANFFGQQGAMTLDPSGLGGVGYRAIRSLVTNFESGSDRFLKKAQRGWSDSAQNGDQILSGLELAFAYALQFLAYNAANFGGVRFARFAGNKFNQGLSFIPGIGFARAFEAEFDPDRIRAKEAFIDSIQRNQLVGVILSIGGYYILKAIADEPDDEKRGWFINGGWGNLTPEKKQQKLAAGEKEYTIGINGKVFNYANWPISSALAAIGSLSDLIRFSPDQWKDKNVTQIMASAAMSGAAAAADIPALSQFQELFGNSLSSKDPNEKRMERFAKVMSSYAGGFVPRILKDIDYAQDPSLRKYETLWEKTASHIPVYRRYEGKEYYDILGQQIQRNVYPGSREFMTKPTDPAYKVLGALNSRGIWLTPANAEHRMVGKGARRRSLTQEEADNYSLETGKGYKQMLMRYGQRALQMPTERAKAFLLDKADDVRDRALKKVYRGYTPAS